MANVLDKLILRVSYSLNKDPKKISIFLQNQGTSSNGFVQLAPRRSEFFTTPSQSFDYQNWLNSLAVHELRHVVQFDKLTGKYNSPPFESIALAVFGIILPPWFYEGDAVTIETALSGAGRGRLPEWSLAIRTNTLSEKKFSYSKDFFGSLKDFTPGYYQLGFFMNSKLRRDYGRGIMDSIFTRISQFPIRPYNLSNSIKKFTGLNTRLLHDSTVSDLESLWKQQLSKVQYQTYVSLNGRKNKTPESYLLPVSIPGDKVLFLLDSKANPPAICLLDKSDKVSNLIRIGYQEVPWFNYAAGKVVWDEFRYDKRYQQRSFNVINIYDLSTSKARQLTHKSRLFAPVLSPDGKIIAAIKVALNNQVQLVEIDAETGDEIRQYTSPGNNMLQMPSFDASGKKIVVVSVASTGKTLLELNRSSGEFTQVLPIQLQEILKPVYAEDQIVFKAHFNGIDNLYRFNPADKEIYQITSARFGIHHPSYDEGQQRLLFNDYQVQGYDIASVKWQPDGGEKISKIPTTYVNYAAPLSSQEGGSNVFDSIPSLDFKSKPYRELSNLFYFHSFYPVTDDNARGLQIQSDNKLNTLNFYTGYQFNTSLRKSEYIAGFSYRRFYPILNVDYINRARLINRRAVVNGQTVLTPVTWRENEIKTETNVPFTFNRFNYTYSTGIKAGTSYTNRYAVSQPFPALVEKISFPMHYQIYAGRSSRRSARDLAPKWGQSFNLTYRHFPFDNVLVGDLLVFKSSFFFPGIHKNHSFQAAFNWQHGAGDYQNTIDIPRVSGYTYMSAIGNPYNTLFLNYRLPLFYPDWELGPLAYIKRIKAGLFADFENVGHGNSFSPRSYGVELRGDMNLLRFYLPNFDLGGKLVFINEKANHKPVFELISTYSF
ncbi:hypothetical protein [Desertivirga xinjiangensis]|uniref:hypothetical protein n=1 Tax=Desertivirga xinjiangensis TaxID=539206 RepID=UPI0021092552|nr:hypothetical protein [Pedobacter xinjiangensis]